MAANIPHFPATRIACQQRYFRTMRLPFNWTTPAFNLKPYSIPRNHETTKWTFFVASEVWIGRVVWVQRSRFEMVSDPIDPFPVLTLQNLRWGMFERGFCCHASIHPPVSRPRRRRSQPEVVRQHVMSEIPTRSPHLGSQHDASGSREAALER